MISEKAFIGAPISFQDKFFIYPPLIKDVINTGNFNLYVDLLTKSQEDIEDILTENNQSFTKMPTPFEYLLGNAYYNTEVETAVKDAFFFFLHEEVSLIYQSKIIVIGNLKQNIHKIKSIDELKIIDENNFFTFQNTLRLSLGMNVVEPPNPNESAGIKHIRAQSRKRERLIAKNKKGVSLSTSLAAICCMDLGINPLNIGELSYAAFKQLMNTYQKKESYELDIQSVLNGADPKKIKPKYWISEQSNLIDIEI